MGTATQRLIAEAAPNDQTSVDELGYFGWFLTMCRDESFRDPARALALVDEALADAPDRSFLIRVRGIALYRLGEFDKCVNTLEDAIASSGLEATDALFLAMAHAQLGNHKASQDWYQKAVQAHRIRKIRHPNAYDWLVERREQAFAEARSVPQIDDDAPSNPTASTSNISSTR